MAPSLRSKGVPVQSLEMRPKIRPLGWVTLWRALRGLRPDIVHTHLPESCWYGLPAAWFAGVGVRVAHLQNCHWRWPRKLRLFDRGTSLFATKAVACSKAVFEFYESEIGYPASKMAIVHNTVDERRFQELPARDQARRTLGLPDDAFVLVCIGSLTEQKGHAYLLEAMSKVIGSCPEALLLLVGDGVLRKRLERDVGERQLAHAVRFLGNSMDVPLILAASDLFVLPSLWEGLPLVLLEAAAAGLATVATDVGGTQELMVNGETGMLIPPGLSEVLSDSIIMLSKNPDRRLEMGRRARQHVTERFSIRKIARAMEEQYLESLDSLETTD